MRRPTARAAISPGVAGIDADVDSQPLVQERDIVRRESDVLDVLDEPVVLGVEDVMHRGQADVLVAAAISGDEVRVEELVVVRDFAAAIVGGDGVAGDAVGIGLDDARPGRSQVPVGVVDRSRHRVVGDVVEECVVRAGDDRAVGQAVRSRPPAVPSISPWSVTT